MEKTFDDVIGMVTGKLRSTIAKWTYIKKGVSVSELICHGISETVAIGKIIYVDDLPIVEIYEEEQMEGRWIVKKIYWRIPIDFDDPVSPVPHHIQRDLRKVLEAYFANEIYLAKNEKRKVDNKPTINIVGNRQKKLYGKTSKSRRY